jgi:hypothetical protein
MTRALEWIGVVWASLWLLIPLSLLGEWIAHGLDRCTGRRRTA